MLHILLSFSWGGCSHDIFFYLDVQLLLLDVHRGLSLIPSTIQVLIACSMQKHSCILVGRAGNEAKWPRRAMMCAYWPINKAVGLITNHYMPQHDCGESL